MTSQHHRFFIVLGFLALFSVSAHADRDGENNALAQIIHELEVLTPLIEEAQAQADKDSRIKFQYDRLALDINHIKSALQAHILAPATQPRRFAPLKGDYRE